jgi:CheY-like chemotaxis protein
MSPQRTATVLVVDDDPDIRLLIEDLLAFEGYRILTAENGADALHVVEGIRPDVILLDINMPVMDGRAFVRAYRATAPPHAPIVCMTAAHNAMRVCNEIHADAILGKPFEVPDLMNCIARHSHRAA